MTSLPQDSWPKNPSLNHSRDESSAAIPSMDRKQFLATSGSLLAATVPGSPIVAHAADPRSSAATARNPAPASNLRKIPIGVFDPVYEKLSLDAMLGKVSALGFEAMEIGTSGY